MAEPHSLPAHVVDSGSGMQPQKPLLQSTPASHEEPQLIAVAAVVGGLLATALAPGRDPAGILQTNEMHCSPVGTGPRAALARLVAVVRSGPAVRVTSSGSGRTPALPSTPGPPSAGAPPSPGGSIVMTSEKLSSPTEDASPRGVPLSIPRSEPHASGAHTTRPTMPASAKLKDMQTPRTITSKAIIHGPRPATRSEPRMPCRTPPTYAPMRAFFRDSR